MKRMALSLLLAFLLLLAACGGSPGVTEAPTEEPSVQNPTNAPTEAPAEAPTELVAPHEPMSTFLSYKELGDVLLPEITPEERSRLTTLGQFAETEKRYYMVRTMHSNEVGFIDYIYYAEKSEPSVWLPLCVKEGCLAAPRSSTTGKPPLEFVRSGIPCQTVLFRPRKPKNFTILLVDFANICPGCKHIYLLFS